MSIKIENCIFASPEQMEFVIMGMRNSRNSWNKSDSYADFDCTACGHIERDGSCIKGDPEREHCHEYYGFELGPNDKSLMQSLSKAGSEHRKYLRMFPVWCNITAPLYWWKEFTMEDFSYEHLNRIGTSTLWEIIDSLNTARNLYLEGGEYKGEHYEAKDKQVWWQMIQLLPSSYNQKRSIFMNGEVLLNIYNQRWGHKLDEWREVCLFIEDCPYWPFIESGVFKKVKGE